MYKALIVDDKAIIRKGLNSSIDWETLDLEPAGEAENGVHALKMIAEEKPDIVITDIRMPDMDGIELLKNICELNSHIVTIVISGYDDFEYAKKAIKYGSIDYIMKPIDPAELNESLKKACGILNRRKAYTLTNEQLLRDYFQKSMKEIKFDPQVYKTLYEEYKLDHCIFHVAVIRTGTGKAFIEDDTLQCNNIKACVIEEGSGVMVAVFFADRRDIAVQSFEAAVYKAAKNIPERIPSKEVSVGIGQMAEKPDSLISSYKTACDAALYCMLPSSERVVCHVQVAGKKAQCIKPDEYESELILNVTSGNMAKTRQILERLFDTLVNSPDVAIESIRQLCRNLCHILIKLDTGFESQISDFLDKLSLPGYMLKFESIHALNQVIYNFYRYAVQEYLDETGGKNSVVTKVKAFIEKNYSEDISLNKLSELFHINASYLTHVFKQEEGDNINTYIVKVRVENAKRILGSGKVNIRKLAESVGYEDSTYFMKVFKKVTGMTPREYCLKSQTQ